MQSLTGEELELARSVLWAARNEIRDQVSRNRTVPSAEYDKMLALERIVDKLGE